VNTEDRTLDLEYEDLRYMEQSTFSTFIDETQAAELTRLWNLREKADDAEFYREYVDGGGDDSY